MWLVTRDTNGLGKRFALPPALRTALVRWYTGSGSQDDHAASVSMVVTARENHKWIACDCLGDEARPPRAAPQAPRLRQGGIHRPPRPAR